MCYMREYRLPPPPGIVFTVGHEEMIYSPYFIAQSERHFARLIRMNFMIYNRNFAQQSRQRVVWKTLKYPHDKQGRAKLIQRNEQIIYPPGPAPVPEGPISVNPGLKFWV